MRDSQNNYKDKRYNLVMTEAARLAGGQKYYRTLKNEARKIIREKARENICLSEEYLKLDAKWNKPTIGYVYIIVNPAWPGWCKVGKTSNLANRMIAYQTSDPFSLFNYVFSIETLHRHSIEKAVLATAAVSSTANLGEWFEIDQYKLTKIIEKVEETVCMLQMESVTI